MHRRIKMKKFGAREAHRDYASEKLERNTSNWVKIEDSTGI